MDPDLPEWDPTTERQVKIDALYAQYEDRQRREADALKRDEAISLPSGMDYAALPGLSRELQGKLATIKPQSIASAARIEGMTPAALSLLIATTKGGRRR